ncbi:MAG: rhomboid family intramembrane serine protease [Candidatus Eisenbacteria bacterium]|nr:rhomboid family intramembrane serine protease [Candidatus Eisenbacteria bacterium]
MSLAATPVSLLTIGITAIVSFAGFSNRRMIRDYAASPHEILRQGKWYQTFTSGLLHVDLGHLFMNMFTLFFFGPPIERLLGGKGFFILYLGSLLAGSILTLILHSRDYGYRAVGASGAVTGVVFSYVLFFPMAPIFIFFIPIGIPAFLFAIGYVALSIVGARRGIGHVGHAAHLGGAIGGALLTLALEPRVVGHFLSHFLR